MGPGDGQGVEEDRARKGQVLAAGDHAAFVVADDVGDRRVVGQGPVKGHLDGHQGV